VEHALQQQSTWEYGQASVLLQLVLEKVCLAIGGMFMLIGAGLHIAKEVGWLVSKGEATLEDHSICSTSLEALQARDERPDINNTGSAPQIFAVIRLSRRSESQQVPGSAVQVQCTRLLGQTVAAQNSG